MKDLNEMKLTPVERAEELKKNRFDFNPPAPHPPNGIHSPLPPHHHEHHPLPHEKPGLDIEFDECDAKTFIAIFGDEDTACAAMRIIMHAPPEMQVIAVQTLKIIEEVLYA